MNITRLTSHTLCLLALLGLAACEEAMQSASQAGGAPTDDTAVGAAGTGSAAPGSTPSGAPGDGPGAGPHEVPPMHPSDPPTDPSGAPGQPPRELPDPDGCSIEEVFELEGCSAGGCHAAPVRAGLDLVSDGLAARLAGAPAQTPGCEGRVLIDPVDPERSLLLQSVGGVAPPGGDTDPCQPIMPPGRGTVSEASLACLQAWVHDVAVDFRPDAPAPAFTPPSVAAAVRKVKMLLTGQAPTGAEVAEVAADPTALRALARRWADGPAFRRKLSDFLTVALQQRLLSLTNDQFDRIQHHRSYREPLQRVLEESFVRTAVDIVERGEPFTEVVRTRRWMVTTANLVLLRYGDQTAQEREQTHTLRSDPADAPRSLRRQVELREWALPAVPADCNIGQPAVLDMLFGTVSLRACETEEQRRIRFPDTPLRPEDFEDWRLVEFVSPGDAPDDPIVPFYDLPTLRGAERIVTRVPRVGFFTTNVFLSNWATNPDNQFRVTANQALLGALHIGFGASEPTEPLRADGLDAEHAEPETACYGCHRQLDPIRLYFARSFNTNYQKPFGDRDGARLFDPMPTASFAFRGVTRDRGGLGRFAQVVADHPRFAPAWVQKLCLYANSARCDEADPVFLEIVERFRDGMNLKDMLVELFTSPLVTGLAQTQTWGERAPLVSITRRAHLCALLDERTERADICGTNRVGEVVGLIPQDGFARGAVDPSQPVRPSPFHFAAAEAVCEAAARVVVVRGDPRFSPDDPERTLDALVGELMALTAEEARYAEVRRGLAAHYEAAVGAGFDARDGLRSAFTLACLSPEVMGVGL